MFYYSTLGVSIESTLEFPELQKIFHPESVDVTIKEERIPKEARDLTLVCPGLWISGQEYLVRIDGVAEYYVSNGKNIIFSRNVGVEEKNVRMYLLSNALAAVIHQRGFIPLHASGFNTDNGVVLIIGESGAGKSTTIKALSKRGFKTFTDDICVVKEINDKPYGIPSYPIIKLWESSFELLEIGDVQDYARIWPEADKFGISFHSTFEDEWKPIWKIFILESSEVLQQTSSLTDNPFEIFRKIGINTYRNEYVEPMKLNALHFKTVSNLVNQCRAYSIVRPSNVNTISEVVDLIIETLQDR